MLINAVEQGSPEWFALKAGKISASRVGNLFLGKSTATRNNLIASLVRERLTKTYSQNTYTSKAMEHGSETEEEARQYYSMVNDVHVQTCGIVTHEKYPFITVSPDGLVMQDNKISYLLEIKCPFADAMHLKYYTTGHHAKQYKYQLGLQMMVCDLDRVDIVSYDKRWPTDMVMATVTVERDQVLEKAILDKILEANDEVNSIIKSLNIGDKK